MISPRAVIGGFIGDHEGKLSVRAADNGNWYDPERYRAGLPQARGKGVNVGSQFGVTAYALIRYRLRKGMPLAQALRITRADVAAITLPIATDIGFELYFREPGFDTLPWDRVTASIVDKAWGSGPGRAVRMLQRLIGVTPDGQIGAATRTAYGAWRAKHGEEGAARLWCEARIAFDTGLATDEGADDPDRIFLGGWTNRSRDFLPGTAWWRAWNRRAA